MLNDDEEPEDYEPSILPEEARNNTPLELEDEGEERLSVSGGRDVIDAQGRNVQQMTGHTLILNLNAKEPQPALSEEPPTPSEEKIEDPTEPLQFFSVNDEPSLDIMNLCLGVLEQRKILILSCYDLEILSDAGYGVAGRFQGERRLLTFREDYSEGREISIDALLSSKVSWIPPTLILVEATGVYSQTFVESLIRESGWLRSARNRLAQRDCRLLILTTPDHLIGIEGISSVHFPVPFLEPRLRQGFPEQAADWLQEIQRQRERGLWGRDEKEFWEKFDGCLKRGILEQEIEKGRRRLADSNRIHSTQRLDRKPLVTPGSELETAALFLAAFLPNLPVEDFEDLLLRLVGNRLQPVKQKSSVLTENEEITQEAVERRTLADEWQENYVEVCQRCRLQFWREAAGYASRSSSVRGVVVDFDTPDLRDQVREEFSTVHYPTLIRLFAQTLEERFLFHYSPAVTEGTRELLLAMAEVDPQRYGSKLLLRLKSDPLSEEAVGDLAQSRGKSGEGVPRQIEPKLLLSRLYQLIRSFLREPVLRDVVHQFLTALIDQRRHEDLLDLVKRLRFAAGFDQVYWWKQLLERGQAGARDRTYQEMYTILQAGGSQVRETLLEIRKWLPDSGQETKSESASRANRLFVDLLEVSIQRSRSRRIAVWPPDDPLQWALAEATSTGEDSSLLEWLFHSSLHPILENEERHRTHVNKLVWTWVLTTAVKSYLHTDFNRLGSRWYDRLKDLPGKILPLASPTPCPMVFQALVLADLATSLRGVKIPGEEDPLERVAANTARLCTPEQRLLLESYWGETINFLLEVQTVILPREGIEDEAFRATRTRLEAQYEGVAELKSIFYLP